MNIVLVSADAMPPPSLTLTPAQQVYLRILGLEFEYCEECSKEAQEYLYHAIRPGAMVWHGTPPSDFEDFCGCAFYCARRYLDDAEAP